MTPITVSAAHVAGSLQQLNGHDREPIDYISLGCPHYHIDELRQIAEFLADRRVHPDTLVHVWTAGPFKYMATTEIPFFEIKNAKAQGIPLRKNVAVDSNGKPTTVAEEALSDDGVANLLPIGGGFKGFGISLLIEVITGALVQSWLSTEQTPGWHPREYGCLVLALDIASFTDKAVFKNAVSDMCRSLRAHPPAEGVAGVAIPGDRGHSKMKAAREVGTIEIDGTVADDLNRLNR